MFIVFKLIKRLIGLLLVAGIVFIALSLWRGGEPFRWFSEKTEKVIEEKSEKIGKEADKLKDAAQRLTEGIRKAAEKIKDIYNRKDEK